MMLNRISVMCAEKKIIQWIGQRLVVALTFVVISLLPRPISAVGLDPVPVFTDADVQIVVQPDLSNPFVEYVYTYTIGNPDTNTGEIWYIKVDISDPEERFDPPANATLPRGMTVVDFFAYRDSIQPLFLPAGQSVVPIGQRVPTGWLGGFGRDGFLGFASGNDTPNILPGESLGGFEITSRRVPSLRQIQVIPDWVFLVLDHDAVSEEELDQAAVVETGLRFTTTTLGPSTVFAPGSFEHWNKLRDDLNQMVDELQWVDPTLGATLLFQLSEARAAWEADDGTTAKAVLQTLLDTLAQAPAGQLGSEARQLVQLNAEALIARTPTHSFQT